MSAFRCYHSWDLWFRKVEKRILLEILVSRLNHISMNTLTTHHRTRTCYANLNLVQSPDGRLMVVIHMMVDMLVTTIPASDHVNKEYLRILGRKHILYFKGNLSGRDCLHNCSRLNT